MSKVRLRFAPSPTGPLHIGGLRTALYNYLIAKSLQGSFILRIEDTDQNRFDERAERHITESLLWSKIIPDESPENPGKYGPYRQSERKEIYQKYVQRLIDEGKAYYAFDNKEQLDKLRSEHEKKGETFVYNWKNRSQLRNSISLNKEEVKKELEKGDYVVRFNSYEEKNKNEFITIKDEIRGEIKVDLKILDDKIILKNDGMPTYHIANVVDDHLMEISHVIRGEEWLPSLALHQLLYNAFQWNKPIFAHLPLILKPTGKGKLSKRDGEKFGIPVYPIEWKESESLTYKGFREIGFEIEAFINFICMIGWNPGTEDEIFTLETLTKIFDTKRIIKSGAKYDYEKAKWFNLEHLKKIETDSLKKEFENKAKTRIKTGLILNEFGEKNQIKVTEQEVQTEVQKQLRMMPGQEKMVMDFYQKNPSALASLRGTVYEEKILNLIKEKGKPNKKEISKDQAEKILKDAHKHEHDHPKEKKETKKKSSSTSAKEKKPASKKAESKPVAKKTKKVSKK